MRAPLRHGHLSTAENIKGTGLKRQFVQQCLREMLHPASGAELLQFAGVLLLERGTNKSAQPLQNRNICWCHLGGEQLGPGQRDQPREGHGDPDLSHPSRVIPQLASAQRAELLRSRDWISLKGATETQIQLQSKRFIRVF